MSHAFGCLHHMAAIYFENLEKLIDKAGCKGKRKKCCFCVRGLAPLFFMSLFCWYHLVFNSPLLQQIPTLKYATGSLMIASLFLYFVAMCMNPGFVAHNHELQQFVRAKRIDLEKQFSPHTNQLMIMRASYCPICDKSVRLLQFHSVLLNNCVGSNNAPCYYLFIFVFFLLSGFLMVLVGIQWRYYIFDLIFVALLVLVLTLLPSLMSAGDVFFMLSSSICKNLTYFQRENSGHHYYLQKRDRSFYNPFNRGCFVNTLEFLIPSMPCLLGGSVHSHRKIKVKEEIQPKQKDAGQYTKVDLSESQESAEMKELFPHHHQMHLFKPNQIYNWGKTNIVSIFDVQDHPLTEVILPAQIKRIKKKKAKRLRKEQEKEALQALQAQRAQEARRTFGED